MPGKLPRPTRGHQPDNAVPLDPGSIAAREEAGFAPSAAAMLAGPPFPPVPLIVLVATDHDVTPDREALWLPVQEQTAALSPKGRFQIVQGAGHFIQKDRPQVVIEAALEAMREAGMQPQDLRQADQDA